MQNPVLNEGIRTFYDESSGLWENMWGDHMHHGYYEVGSNVKKSRQQAQIDMIEKVLSWAGITDVSRMVDVGCGIGGSSRCALTTTNGQLHCSCEPVPSSGAARVLVTLLPLPEYGGNSVLHASKGWLMIPACAS